MGRNFRHIPTGQWGWRFDNRQPQPTEAVHIAEVAAEQGVAVTEIELVETPADLRTPGSMMPKPVVADVRTPGQRLLDDLRRENADFNALLPSLSEIRLAVATMLRGE